MRDDDERYWTTWQRNRHVNRCSAYFDDEPEQGSGPVVWLMVVLMFATILAVAFLIVLGVMHLAEKFVT